MFRLSAVFACAFLTFSMLVQAESLWVAVGQEGRRISSHDGTKWENDQRWSDNGSDPDQTLLGIAYGKASAAKTGRFIAVGGGPKTGHLLATEDGKKWIELPQREGPVAAIAFGQRRFVATNGGRILYSIDGEQFIAGAKLDWPGTIHPRKLVFGEGEGGGMFVIIGEIDLADESQSVNWRAVTPDGESFAKAEQHTPPARDLAFGSGHFVVVGPAGLIESSHDGLTWQRCESDPAEDFQSVIWTGKRFIAQGKTIWTSPDGLTWTRDQSLKPRCTIVWADELKAAPSIHALGLGWDGGFHASKDLLEWAKATVPPGPPLTAVASSE